jgi:hypothetical protein
MTLQFRRIEQFDVALIEMMQKIIIKTAADEGLYRLACG